MKKYCFQLGLFILIITALMFLQPTIRSTWDRNYQQRLIFSFIEKIILTNSIDTKEFWLFRERFSAGNFTINPKYVEIFQTYRIVGRKDSGVSDLFYYHGPLLVSTESITTRHNELILLKENIPASNLIFQSDDILISIDKTYSLDNSQFILNLWFIKPINIMQETVGFFDYLPQEMELLSKASWFHHSRIYISRNMLDKIQKIKTE